MLNFKSPVVRWLVVVGVVMSLTISLHTWQSTRHHTHRADDVYDIHFVNYRGRTDVDVGFEDYLEEQGIKFKITYHDLALDPSKAEEVRDAIEADLDTDLVVTWGTTATLSMIGRHESPTSARMTSIPTIFTVVANPTRAGIIAGRYVPRTNVTGSSHVAPIYNQFRTMMAYHQAPVIGMLFTTAEMNSIQAFQEMRRYASNHDVEVIGASFDVTPDGKPSAANAEEALRQLKAKGAQWLYLPPDSFLTSQAKKVIPLAHSLGLRTFASTEPLMQAGAGYGLISPYLVIGAHTASQAKKVLVDHVAPEDITVDISPRFIHQVNVDVLASMHLPLPFDKLNGIEVLTNESLR